MNYIYRESLVTRDFHDLIKQNYPLDGKQLPLLRLLDYLLTSNLRDKQNGLVMLPREVCMACRNGNLRPTSSFAAEPMIQDFRKTVFDLDIIPAINKRRCRLVRSMAVPLWLARAFETMIEGPPWERTVGFVSGWNVNRDAFRILRKSEADAGLVNSRSAVGAEVARYLHDLPESLFQPVLERLPQAFQMARSIADPDLRKPQLTMLNSVHQCVQPFYKPVASTTRLYTFDTNFLNLTTSLRDELTSVWVKCDLKQAQLRIFGLIWKVEPLLEFLGRLKQSFWREIAEAVGLPYSEDLKGAIKDSTYAVLYGSSKANILAGLGDTMRAEDAAAMLNLPVYRVLFAAAKNAQKSLKRNGYVLDATGRRLEVATWRDGEAKTEQEKVRSILACQSQSYELPILYPAVEYAKQTMGRSHPLYVTAWLHDGIWLHCDDPSLLKQDIANVKLLVEETSARLLGRRIPLDVEFP